MQLLMCGLTKPVLISTIYLSILSLVVHLDQLEFGDATGIIIALTREIGGSNHHLAPPQIGLCPTIEALLGWHRPCVRACGERRVSVMKSATLA